VLIFSRIHRHYQEVRASLRVPSVKLDVSPRSVQTIILVDDVHAETVRMVNFAKSLGHAWKAVHVEVNPEKTELVKQRWAERIGEGELVILSSPYRHLAAPIREYVMGLLAESENGFVHVIMGHLAMETFWEQALHQNSAFIFNVALTGMERVVVTQVPYQVHHTRSNGK